MFNMIFCFLLGGACGYLIHELTHVEKVKILVLSNRELTEEELKEAVIEEVENEENTDKQTD